MVKLRVKLVKVGNSLRVAIPAIIVQEMGLKAGDTLLIDYDESKQKIVLEKQFKSE
jgi:AbrB family looped-hinge helix DNA binding protein